MTVYVENYKESMKSLLESKAAGYKVNTSNIDDTSLY